MIYEIDVNSHPNQEQSFNLFGYRLRFDLRFNSVAKGWAFDLWDKNANDFITQNCWLAVNSPALIGKNLPFVVVLIDESGLGLNSIHQSDMGSRLKIYFVEKEVFHEAI